MTPPKHGRPGTPAMPFPRPDPWPPCRFTKGDLVRSKLEMAVANRLTRAKIPFEREFRFHPVRRWRADFLVEPMILIEVEGGLFTAQSGHRSAAGVMRDIEKGNEAVALGYRLVRVSQVDLASGNRWLEIVRQLRG